MRNGAVYVRVVRRKDHPRLFPRWIEPYGHSLESLIQYWYFYRYDEWTTRVLAGTLVQRHEGDWETVIVGLSDDEPLFVAYSQHCGGEWKDWQDVTVASTRPPRTHPLVAVAKGSQANYASAGQHTPDCIPGLSSGTLSLLSYAVNIRDRTAYGVAWRPIHTIQAEEDRPPMSFPGLWGAHDVALLRNKRKPPIVLDRGGAPASPSMQAPWRKPVYTMFCSERWHGPDELERPCKPPKPKRRSRAAKQ